MASPKVITMPGNIEPEVYHCYRTYTPLEIDGNLEKPVWKKARKSKRFVDLVSGRPAFFETRLACLADDHYFYVAFWLEEPDLQAQLAERDSFLWLENDVEVFMAGPDCYYELQINALGTIYEVFLRLAGSPSARRIF